MGTMPTEKYTQLIEKLEVEELEGQNLGAEYFSQLMALYLYKDDLVSAKYLWIRMPQALKDVDELKCLHQLLKCAMDNNTAEFLKAAQFNWPEVLKPIIHDLIEKVRNDVFELVGEAYTSILEDDLMTMTNMSHDEVVSKCKQLQWSFEKVGEQQFVLPTPLPTEEEPLENSEDQLEKLTDFVTFLES